MSHQINIVAFVNGATMMASLVASLFFFKFQRATNDRFFTLFALAFLLLAIDRIAIVLSGSITEVDPAVYAIRFSAFLMIIAAVVQKNRKTRT